MKTLLTLFVLFFSSSVVAEEILKQLEKNWSEIFIGKKKMQCSCILDKKENCQFDGDQNTFFYYSEDFDNDPAIIFRQLHYKITKITDQFLLGEFSNYNIKINNKSSNDAYTLDLITEKKLFLCE